MVSKTTDIDFNLKPFNRKDVYEATFIVKVESEDTIVSGQMTTAHPVNLVDPNREIVKDVAKHVGKIWLGIPPNID